MRYELADYEWIAIKPMLPNKPRGVPRVNDRRVIPPKRNRNDPICFSPYLYRARNRVERFFKQDQTMSSGGDALRQACRQLPCLRSTRVN